MPDPASRVVMFHVGRCGSTVVAEMLGHHPLVRWDGEVFEPKVRARIGREEIAPESFLLERMATADDVYGFEVKYLPSHHQLTLGLDLAEIIDLTDRVGVTYFVTLHRRNYLRRVVSGAIGRERRRWHRVSGEPAVSTKVHLDPEAVPFGPRQPLLAVFEEMRTGEKELRSLLAERAALHLVYEDDVVGDPYTAYDAICQFVGIEPLNIKPGLEPTGAEPLSSMVMNYDEIVKLLADGEYSWMLD